MKAARYLLTIVWLALAGHTMADDFTIADFTIQNGETKTISIELNNTKKKYIAFEFYLTLPEGITIPEDEDGYLMVELNSARINRHVLEVSLMPDSTYHFLCYSSRNSQLRDTSGEIISLTIQAEKTIYTANKQGKLFAQKLSDPNGNKVTFKDFTFNVSIKGLTPQIKCPHGCLLGDMNQDGTLSIADVMMLVGAIIGN